MRNRPVEALRDTDRSISLNNNRAPFRSKLLLDEDLAARGASLARAYRDLGFEQSAVIEGYKALSTDASSSAAHRFLAELYSSLPRYEIARVSELLQSQLLQGQSIAPVSPQLGDINFVPLQATGPARSSTAELTPLFERNRLALQGVLASGNQDTFADELLFSGIRGPISFALSQSHYETSGFRVNDDVTQNTHAASLQSQLTPTSSFQVEYKNKESETGDIGVKLHRFQIRCEIMKTQEAIVWVITITLYPSPI